MSARDARVWTHAALFGSLWGALEMSVGTVVKASRIPLAGVVMACLGLLCMITLRRLQPWPGVVFTAGVVAAFLKVFALGGLYPGPIVAILMEAAMVELAFLTLGNRVAAAVAGGALSVGIGPAQLLITLRLVAGREILESVIAGARRLLVALDAPHLPAVSVLLAVMIAFSLVGAAAGAAAWGMAGRVLRRTGSGT